MTMVKLYLYSGDVHATNNVTLLVGAYYVLFLWIVLVFAKIVLWVSPHVRSKEDFNTSYRVEVSIRTLTLVAM